MALWRNTLRQLVLELADVSLSSMRSNRVIMAIVALLCSSLLAAIGVLTSIGSPPEGIELLAYLSLLFGFVLVGPLSFAWAWGPSPMSSLAIILAFLLPIASLVSLYLGFIRAGSLRWLAAATVIWSGLGGYSAWLAILGSV